MFSYRSSWRLHGFNPPLQLFLSFLLWSFTFAAIIPIFDWLQSSNRCYSKFSNVRVGVRQFAPAAADCGSTNYVFLLMLWERKGVMEVKKERVCWHEGDVFVGTRHTLEVFSAWFDCERVWMRKDENMKGSWNREIKMSFFFFYYNLLLPLTLTTLS